MFEGASQHWIKTGVTRTPGPRGRDYSHNERLGMDAAKLPLLLILTDGIKRIPTGGRGGLQGKGGSTYH